MRRVISVAVVSAMALVVLALPAMATVDEITGMPCSGENAIFAPPGVSKGPTSKNFAKPLFATGIASFDPFYDGSTAVVDVGPAPLFSFNFDHPASKIVGTGDIVFFAEAGVYVTDFEVDLGGAFANCKALRP